MFSPKDFNVCLFNLNCSSILLPNDCCPNVLFGANHHLSIRVPMGHWARVLISWLHLWKNQTEIIWIGSGIGYKNWCVTQ